MKAIPNESSPEQCEDSAFLHSGFIQVESNHIIDVQMQYPILGMHNAEKKCFVRKEVYDMLFEAAKLLPKGFKFRILDAWRPFALQRELYEVYSIKIIDTFGLQNLLEEQQKKTISKFVSEPIANRDVPPVHTTGGAIDITIIDDNGIELDMGTKFDAFTDKTHTAYFENGMNDSIRDNRRLLYGIMTKVGFTNLPSEWWHYDYGDRFWAFYRKKPAIYRGVFTKEEIYG